MREQEWVKKFEELLALKLDGKHEQAKEVS